MTTVELENLIRMLTAARVELEQGGKYHWNDCLENCDILIRNTINSLDSWKTIINFSKGK